MKPIEKYDRRHPRPPAIPPDPTLAELTLLAFARAVGFAWVAALVGLGAMAFFVFLVGGGLEKFGNGLKKSSGGLVRFGSGLKKFGGGLVRFGSYMGLAMLDRLGWGYQRLETDESQQGQHRRSRI